MGKEWDMECPHRRGWSVCCGLFRARVLFSGSVSCVPSMLHATKLPESPLAWHTRSPFGPEEANGANTTSVVPLRFSVSEIRAPAAKPTVAVRGSFEWFLATAWRKPVQIGAIMIRLMTGMMLWGWCSMVTAFGCNRYGQCGTADLLRDDLVEQSDEVSTSGGDLERSAGG